MAKPQSSKYLPNISCADFNGQENNITGVCENISSASKFEIMKSTRTPLTPEQLEEARRLKAEYESQKAIAKRNGRNLTQEDVADRCGWKNQSAVSQYLNGRIALNLDALIKLSKAIGFDPRKVSPRLARFMAPPSVENIEPLKNHKTMYSYPVISWVQAGTWSEAFELFEPGNAERYMDSSDDTVGEGLWLRVRGDSMTGPGPVSFPDGMMILLDNGLYPKSGQYAVFRLRNRNEATFKQYVEDAGNKYLKPLNPQFPIIELTEECDLVGTLINAQFDKTFLLGE